MKLINTATTKALLQKDGYTLRNVPKQPGRELIVVFPLSVPTPCYKVRFVSSGVYAFQSLARNASERIRIETGVKP